MKKHLWSISREESFVADKRLSITVPASSANLGPGFDSVGLAVNRYLTLYIDRAEEWEFFSNSSELSSLPNKEDNLVYQAAAAYAAEYDVELSPCRVEMVSDIPLARGLGSSASAIIAGIELADEMAGLHRSKEEKMQFASGWEGHPDNVGPSLYGGLIVGAYGEEKTHVMHCGVPDVDLVLAIPDNELLTKEARGALPSELPYATAIHGSAVSNVLVAAILKEDWKMAGEMMVRDVFHHPYRADMVPGLEEMLSGIRQYGAYGAALSGAGPTILCFVPSGRGEEVKRAIKEDYPSFRVETAKPAPFGSSVHYVNQPAGVSSSV